MIAYCFIFLVQLVRLYLSLLRKGNLERLLYSILTSPSASTAAEPEASSSLESSLS